MRKPWLKAVHHTKISRFVHKHHTNQKKSMGTHKYWKKTNNLECGRIESKKHEERREKKRNREKGWKLFSRIFQQVHVVRVCVRIYVFLVLLFSNHGFFMSHFLFDNTHLFYSWEFRYGWALFFYLNIIHWPWFDRGRIHTKKFTQKKEKKKKSIRHAQVMPLIRNP